MPINKTRLLINKTLRRRRAACVSLVFVAAVSFIAWPFVRSAHVDAASRSHLSASGLQNRIEDVEMFVLPAPEFKRERAATRAGRARLVIASSRANDITDTEEWFKKNKLTLSSYEVTNTPVDASGGGSSSAPLPSNVPRRYAGNMLTRAMPQNASTLLVYGQNYAEGRYLVSMNPATGVFRYGFDFVNYTYPPGITGREREFVYQNIDWAVEEGDVLYVAHSHATYARSSKGMNAYITAINTRSRRVVWRSAPLVSNASNFEVVGDFVVSGYGFTNEPDFLYLLDKKTGEVVHQLPVKSGATYIIRKGDKIYVRAYNADFVIGIVSGRRR